jgi:hypothetical protein
MGTHAMRRSSRLAQHRRHQHNGGAVNNWGRGLSRLDLDLGFELSHKHHGLRQPPNAALRQNSPPSDPMSLRFAPHIIYSLALASFSMHLLYERRATEEDRVHYSGKISILETLVQNLERGQMMDPREVERLRKLAGVSTSQVPETNRNPSNVGWWEVLLGKTPSEQTSNGSALRDQGDWEKRR